MTDLAKHFPVFAGAVAVVMFMPPTIGVSVEQQKLKSMEPKAQ